MLIRLFSESGTSNSFDWSLFFAGISVIVSFITLYLAHIRGPKFVFVIPNSPYPVTGYHSDQNTLEFELLIVNTGIRSGILYEIRILPDKIFVQPQSSSTEFGSNQEKWLPKVLTPGQEWKGKAQVTLGLNSIESQKYLASNDTVKLTISYSHDTTFGRLSTNRRSINLDVRTAKASQKS